MDARAVENVRKKRPSVATDEDNESHYGSFTGETFASRMSGRSCAHRKRSIDILAKSLREYQWNSSSATDGGAEAGQTTTENGKRGEKGSGGELATRRCINQTFHHYRFVVIMLGGVSVGLMMLLRYNIAIAILRMVNQTHLYLEEHPDRTVDDFLEEGYILGGDFNWNNEIVAIILSWYMFSYTLPQMPSSRLAMRIGGRLSVPISLSICALATLLTPWSAFISWKLVVVLRLVNGLGASAVLPMMLNSVETWMRYDEISLGLSIGQTMIATLVTLYPLISGQLAAIHWSYAFYVPAGITFVFSALWLVLVSDSPAESPFVSDQELRYIHASSSPSSQRAANDDEKGEKSSTTTTTTTSNNNNNNNKKQAATPAATLKDEPGEDESVYQASSWLQILKVPSFYAYISIWIFYCSSYSAFNFVLPTYLRQFLKINIAENGFYCFIIQVGGIISVLWPHPVLRLLQNNFGFSNTQARITAYAICCFLVAATWCYVGSFHDTQLLLLFINRAFHAGNDIIVTGSLMSNYAKAGLSGMAFSLVNTFGNLSIVGFSTLIGWVLDYTNQSREGWCWVYTGLGLVQVFMFAVFSLFISSEPIKFQKTSPGVESGAKQKAVSRESPDAAKPQRQLEESKADTAQQAAASKSHKHCKDLFGVPDRARPDDRSASDGGKE